ncbi:hypothetical protein Ocin01_14692 [Orchesella cincta]|uniref:Uncharacterized protein n=1 Tax=Orchesella cincta TaxID=48709 RepID=A0A1D2MG69_ORCCI|nr:hypothetical protein Ocin01_14692 [Orchesella cincta]
MTPATNLRGSGDTLCVPGIPVAERFRRRVEQGGGDASTQRAATETHNQQQLSQRQTMVSQTYSRGSGGSGRSWKEMLDAAKALHTSADNLQERICQLHCKFADVIVKSALLFDPTTVEMMGSGNGIPADLPSPTSAHFTRQEVDDNYERLVQGFLNERPGLEK